MDYSWSYNLGGGTAGVAIVVWIILVVLAIVGLWKTLQKAGLPGWAAIIPFYNEYNIVKMSNRPIYFFWVMLVCGLLAWIPLLGWLLMIVAFVMWVFVALDIAANFGQGTGFAILLIIFPVILFLVLGFGGYQFNRIAAPGTAGFGAPPMPAGGSYSAAPPVPPAPPATPPAGQAAAPPPPQPQQAPPAAPATPPQTPPASGTENAPQTSESPDAPTPPDAPPAPPLS